MSDGSYKTDRVGAATIIETFDCQTRLIIPVQVPASSLVWLKTDSYRAEAVGLIVGLHIVIALETFTGMTTKIDIACDNDRVLEAAECYRLIGKRWICRWGYCRYLHKHGYRNMLPNSYLLVGIWFDDLIGNRISVLGVNAAWKHMNIF